MHVQGKQSGRGYRTHDVMYTVEVQRLHVIAKSSERDLMYVCPYPLCI